MTVSWDKKPHEPRGSGLILQQKYRRVILEKSVRSRKELEMKLRKEGLFDDVVFPGGKTKAFTMSYDDGTIHDRRFVKILDQYGIRATFNLNSGFFGIERKNLHEPLEGIDVSVIDENEVNDLYKGHEVAGHGLMHASPVNVGAPRFMTETIEDRLKLEAVTGKMVRGYAYPFGMYNDDIKNILRLAGYRYARVVETTGTFLLPQDFLEWRGTCHHNDRKLMELAEDFCSDSGFALMKKLFYVWGHSYEFAGDNSWEMIETFCRYMKEHGEKVWFATNIEIADYVNAFRSLEYGAGGDMIYNPSGLTVSIMRDFKVYTIKPLETVLIG